MDVYPKFIIETDDEIGDYLIIGKCTYHYQLAYNVDKVKGGGWWTLDNENKVFTLFGESDQFKQAVIEDIAKCVQQKKVFTNYTMFNNLTNKFKFRYRNINGEIIDLEN